MSKPRWKCPVCGDTNVQICLPAWFKETGDGDLTHVDTDTAAEILSWSCEGGCGDGGSGRPDTNE